MAFRGLAITIFVSIVVVTFVFAGVSYASEAHLEAIIATGLLAAALLVMQTLDRDTLFRPEAWNPKTWNLKRTWNTLIVGIAIHYSAIIIGVSFGAVFSAENDSGWAIIAVLVQQAVLTRAAWILVDEYRRSNVSSRTL